MAIGQRKDSADFFNSIKRGEVASVYLLFGERYLCQEMAGELVALLLPDEKKRQTGLRVIDGERENVREILAHLRTYGLFQGRQVVRIFDTRLFHSKNVAKNIWSRAEKAFAAHEQEKAAKALLEFFALAGIEAGDWRAEEMAAWPEERWQAVFNFSKPSETEWVEQVLPPDDGGPVSSPAAPGGGGGDLLAAALERGLPAGNVLLLTAETVDKRSRLFRHLKEKEVVIDLSVETGGSSAARKEQDAVIRELVQRKLAEHGKKMEPRALTMLLDRVGFQPVAAVMEAEKLALYAEEERVIGVEALNTLVGWTREEALYEFTEALAGRDTGRCLLIMKRMMESGVHALVLLAALRNHLRRLMLAKALQEEAGSAYAVGMPYGVFQKNFLPRLAAEGVKLPKEVDGHPFAVYKTFQQAEGFSLAGLQHGLVELLQAEYRLKSAGMPEALVVEGCIFAIIPPGGEAGRSA